VYHIDEDKFSSEDLNKFKERDKYVNAYHVISKNTLKQVEKLTDKKIYSIPFWINEKLWFPINSKIELRKKYNIESNCFLIGSFQRDTEGSDLISPKLSKGPDRFLEIVKKINKKNENTHVLLAGKRRQYLISELEKNQINFSYYEMPPFNELNELYNCLDLYIVSSRYEGGPQAIFECALTKTPIISTNVGVAPEVLSPNSIYDMSNFGSAKPDIDYAFSNAQKYIIPDGFENFIKMFNEVLGDQNEK
jgi:glycosyltransferase involved in cell wall biosynthesis